MHSLAKRDSHIHIGWALFSPKHSVEGKGQDRTRKSVWGSIPYSTNDLLWGTRQLSSSRYSMPESTVKKVPKEVFPWKRRAAASICHGHLPHDDTSIASWVWHHAQASECCSSAHKCLHDTATVLPNGTRGQSGCSSVQKPAAFFPSHARMWDTIKICDLLKCQWQCPDEKKERKEKKKAKKQKKFPLFIR